MHQKAAMNKILKILFKKTNMASMSKSAWCKG